MEENMTDGYLLAGAILGALIGVTIRVLIERLWRKDEQKRSKGTASKDSSRKR